MLVYLKVGKRERNVYGKSKCITKSASTLIKFIVGTYIHAEHLEHFRTFPDIDTLRRPTMFILKLSLHHCLMAQVNNLTYNIMCVCIYVYLVWQDHKTATIYIHIYIYCSEIL